jgi:hypothetical protein
MGQSRQINGEIPEIRLNSRWRRDLISSPYPKVYDKIPQIGNKSSLRRFLLLSPNFYG